MQSLALFRLVEQELMVLLLGNEEDIASCCYA